MTWEGRRLISTTKNGALVQYSYDDGGLRVSKQDSNGITRYTYDNGRIVHQYTENNNVISNELFFRYDENGAPLSVSYNGTEYFYVLNLQGDIIGIINNAGALVVEYTYDSWGYHSSDDISGTMANTLGTVNPLRYRGYYYDTDMGFYYCISRYYDPEVGRWISVDSVIAGVGGSTQGYNMFAYCFNNPVNRADSTGNWPKWMTDAYNWFNDNIIQPIANFFEPTTNTISGQFQDGIFRGSGSLTGGYSEFNERLQINSKDSNDNGMFGGFGKVSVGNASGKVGIGNDNVALSLKGVGDGLTATTQAGLQYKNGFGFAAKAKAAVLTGRATVELELFGWQIELGVSGDLLSAGAEAMIGVFPDEGFIAKANVGAGLFGAGFVFRVKPAQ